MLEKTSGTAIINRLIDCLNDKGKVSDGSHTFDELYYHRMVLFSIITNSVANDLAWKSWKHFDGTMYKDYFIVGVTTPEGDYTYHYHKKYWDYFNVRTLDFAPRWDGHSPSNIDRLYSIIK